MALPNYMVVPTLDGFKHVRDIQVGDYLFSELGEPTKVINVKLIPQKRFIYRLQYTDGRVVDTDSYQTFYTKMRSQNPYRVFTVYKMWQKYQREVVRESCRFLTKLGEPAQYREKRFEIPPYTVGQYIADVESLATGQLIGKYPALKKITKDKKSIPRAYLTASVYQRFSLLQGICDANSYVSGELCKRKKLYARLLVHLNSQYAQQCVVQLCQSLGIKVLPSEHKRNRRVPWGSLRYDKAWEVTISTDRKSTYNMFYKNDKVRDTAINNIYSKCKENRTIGIRKMEFLNKKDVVTEITVDNPTKQYLIGRYIVSGG